MSKRNLPRAIVVIVLLFSGLLFSGYVSEKSSLYMMFSFRSQKSLEKQGPVEKVKEKKPNSKIKKSNPKRTRKATPQVSQPKVIEFQKK